MSDFLFYFYIRVKRQKVLAGVKQYITKQHTDPRPCLNTDFKDSGWLVQSLVIGLRRLWLGIKKGHRVQGLSGLHTDISTVASGMCCINVIV